MAVPPVSLKRSLGFVAIGGSLAFAVALSACGGNGESGQPEIVIQPSSYSTIVSTTAASGSDAGQPVANGGTVAGTQVYEVQSGDFLAAIADDYGIPPESIANFNQWDEGVTHMLHPGDVINIPPGAAVPDAGDEDDEDSGSDSDSESDSDSDSEEDPDATEDAEDEEGASPDDEPECPDGTPQGTYTLEAGDIPARVAEALDVTLDQLDEANSNTPGYSSFIVDTEILVPCGDDE